MSWWPQKPRQGVGQIVISWNWWHHKQKKTVISHGFLQQKSTLTIKSWQQSEFSETAWNSRKKKTQKNNTGFWTNFPSFPTAFLPFRQCLWFTWSLTWRDALVWNTTEVVSTCEVSPSFLRYIKSSFFSYLEHWTAAKKLVEPMTSGSRRWNEGFGEAESSWHPKPSTWRRLERW